MAALGTITGYFQDLAIDSDENTEIIVRISTIGAMISELSQVLDYSELTINGQMSNIVLGMDEVPVLEEVIVSAES